MRSMWRVMTTSVRLAENGREGDFEDLVIEIVADMHHPVAPVFRALFHDQRSHHAGGAVARLGEAAHDGAELIDANFAGTGAVEIDLGHVGLLHRANLHLKNTSSGFHWIFR